jgi:hypothetical protein
MGLAVADPVEGGPVAPRDRMAPGDLACQIREGPDSPGRAVLRALKKWVLVPSFQPHFWREFRNSGPVTESQGRFAIRPSKEIWRMLMSGRLIRYLIRASDAYPTHKRLANEGLWRKTNGVTLVASSCPRRSGA